MATILFVTWDGGGNVPPALDIATELLARGHSVRVLGHEGVSTAASRAGVPFVAYPTARPFSSQRNNPPVTLVKMWGGRDLGRDVLAELDRVPADVVVVDCMLLGVMAELRAAGVRYVALEHLFDAFFTTWRKGPLGRLSSIGKGSAEALMAAAAVRLVATSPSLDPAYGEGQPANVDYCGPTVQGRPAEPEQPTVLVSLSTYAYSGMVGTLQRVIDACADLPCRVVLTTGPVVEPSELRTPSNTEVHRFVPHAELMPQVSMVVSHGGHSTTMLALAHDLPMLVLPMHPLVDQPMVGTAVEAAGAGRRLRKSSSASKLRPVIEELLGDGPHRAAAARLGAEIRGMQGAQSAARRIEGLLTNGVQVRP